jgi:hypothetical protein
MACFLAAGFLAAGLLAAGFLDFGVAIRFFTPRIMPWATLGTP